MVKYSSLARNEQLIVTYDYHQRQYTFMPSLIWYAYGEKTFGIMHAAVVSIYRISFRTIYDKESRCVSKNGHIIHYFT